MLRVHIVLGADTFDVESDGELPLHELLFSGWLAARRPPPDGGMTAAEESAVFDRTAAQAQRLRTLGGDEAQPSTQE